MNIVVVGYTYRTVDNLTPLLDELERRGHRVSSCFFPVDGPANNVRLCSLPYRNMVCRPIANLGGALGQGQLDADLRATFAVARPDLVLVDDLLNAPSNRVHDFVKREAPHVRVGAFQHGFFQFWGQYRRNFACDFFCAYGDRDRREFPTPLDEQVLVTGLPKLSRLAGVPVTDDGSLLFIAQDTPHPGVLGPVLSELSRRTGRPVRVRPHPDHPASEVLASEGLEVVPASFDLQPLLAGCHAVITTGSTAGMEALVLGKPVVSVPSYSSSIFRDSPCVALDCTAEAIIRVLDGWGGDPEGLAAFLANAVSPLSFDLPVAAALVEQAAAAPVERGQVLLRASA